MPENNSNIFNNFIYQINENIKSYKIAEIFRSFDTNNDGEISLEEFQNSLRDKNGVRELNENIKSDKIVLNKFTDIYVNNDEIEDVDLYLQVVGSPFYFIHCKTIENNSIEIKESGILDALTQLKNIKITLEDIILIFDETLKSIFNKNSDVSAKLTRIVKELTIGLSSVKNQITEFEILTETPLKYESRVQSSDQYDRSWFQKVTRPIEYDDSSEKKNINLNLIKIIYMKKIKKLDIN